MYRVLLFFRVLEYNLVVSLLTTTMVRNFVYIIYTAHWAGAPAAYPPASAGITVMPCHAVLLPDQPQTCLPCPRGTHESVHRRRVRLFLHRITRASHRVDVAGHVSRSAVRLAIQVR